MKWRRGQGEIDMRFTTLTRMADNVMIYKYVGEECRVEARHDRDLHAQASLWRQRLGHARPSNHLERQEADLRR